MEAHLSLADARHCPSRASLLAAVVVRLCALLRAARRRGVQLRRREVRGGCAVRGGPDGEYKGLKANSKDDEMCVKVQSSKISVSEAEAAKALQEFISFTSKGIDGTFKGPKQVLERGSRKRG